MCLWRLTQAILHVYHYGVAIVTDEASVVQRFGGGAGDEVASMDPHHDRKLGGRLQWEIHTQRNVYVQVQTVLTHLNTHHELKYCNHGNERQAWQVNDNVNVTINLFILIKKKREDDQVIVAWIFILNTILCQSIQNILMVVIVNKQD